MSLFCLLRSLYETPVRHSVAAAACCFSITFGSHMFSLRAPLDLGENRTTTTLNAQELPSSADWSCIRAHLIETDCKTSVTYFCHTEKYIFEIRPLVYVCSFEFVYVLVDSWLISKYYWGLYLSYNQMLIKIVYIIFIYFFI